MSEVLVRCDGARSNKRPPSKSLPDSLQLSTVGDQPNVRLQIDVFRSKFLRDLPERLDDLIRIAAFVYAADTRVKRGSTKDVFASKWHRSFRMVLPVWDLEFWEASHIQEALVQTLSCLTGDEFIFEFTQRASGKPLQQLLQFKELVDPLPQVDSVILFSGGVDSLAAVVEAVNEGKHPILVSHRAAPVLDTRQRNLVKHIRERFPSWSFPHVSMWVNRAGGTRPGEFTQRSRSFLFTCMGAVTAAQLDLDDVLLCDNGVVSINLPQSKQNVGTFLSRSTHPRYLASVQVLIRDVTGRSGISVRNNLIFKTKREVIEILSTVGHPELLQEAVSCAHVEGKTSLKPHCGVCTQCIDRRFASIASGLVQHDLVSRYEKDIFLDPLQDGEERTHAENYVRFAAELEALESADKFFEEFPELIDCLPTEGDINGFAQCLWDLFKRHQKTVNGVLESQLEQHLTAIRRGVLPTNCLLRIVSSGQHTSDPRMRYVDRLRALLCKSIPTAFQTHSAKNERNVQDIGEAVFQAAQMTLQREAPQIPFAAVTTKPDFSDMPSGGIPLFIEFKHVKDRKRLNAIHTEMTSRVTVYRDQGAWVLFVVYDPNHCVTDDDKFTQAFEAHEGIWVGMAR